MRSHAFTGDAGKSSITMLKIWPSPLRIRTSPINRTHNFLTRENLLGDDSGQLTKVTFPSMVMVVKEKVATCHDLHVLVMVQFPSELQSLAYRPDDSHLEGLTIYECLPWCFGVNNQLWHYPADWDGWRCFGVRYTEGDGDLSMVI